MELKVEITDCNRQEGRFTERLYGPAPTCALCTSIDKVLPRIRYYWASHVIAQDASFFNLVDFDITGGLVCFCIRSVTDERAAS